MKLPLIHGSISLMDTVSDFGFTLNGYIARGDKLRFFSGIISLVSEQITITGAFK